jgi:hypothetical protein
MKFLIEQVLPFPMVSLKPSRVKYKNSFLLKSSTSELGSPLVAEKCSHLFDETETLREIKLY